MTSTEQPSHILINADNLHEACLPDLLLYGLTLGDDDPALGVLFGVRRELGLVASLAERGHPGADSDLAEIVPVLESLGRRLDVAIELFARAQRTHTPEEGALHEDTTSLRQAR